MVGITNSSVLGFTEMCFSAFIDAVENGNLMSTIVRDLVLKGKWGLPLGAAVSLRDSTGIVFGSIIERFKVEISFWTAMCFVNVKSVILS